MKREDVSAVFALEPEAAVRFLRSKGYAVSFDWYELQDRAHARAFTVAKAMRMDVLQDIRQAVQDVIEQGLTQEVFIDRLRAALQARGWWGKQEVVNPATGEVKTTHVGLHRLRTIYRTNLQSAYMAGRYEAMKASAESHPNWQYIAVLDGRTRPSHRAMNGRVFRHDDPIWDSIYPPNGFNCRCRVRALRDSSISKAGLSVERSEGQLTEVMRPVTADKAVPVTGLKTLGPDGKPAVFAPDAGFGFNAGARWLRPFTPPPLDDLPRSFPFGVSLPGLPAPTPLPASRLLPAGLSDVAYANAFLEPFGASVDAATVYTDVAQEPLAISADLFRDGSGQWKVTKDGRERYLLALADALKAPDEIWLRWEASRQQPGQWLLKRRYIKSYALEGDGGLQYGLSVFEMGDDGWTGSTTMMANIERSEAARQRYIERQRDGFLLYRKPINVTPQK